MSQWGHHCHPTCKEVSLHSDREGNVRCLTGTVQGETVSFKQMQAVTAFWGNTTPASGFSFGLLNHTAIYPQSPQPGPDAGTPSAGTPCWDTRWCLHTIWWRRTKRRGQMGFHLFIKSSTVSMECCFEKGFSIAPGLRRKVSHRKEAMVVIHVRKERREGGSWHKLSICHPWISRMLENLGEKSLPYVLTYVNLNV